MDTLTKVVTYLSGVEMLSMVVIASIIMVKIWFDFRFRYFLLLCLILILTDLASVMVAIGWGLETTDIHTD